MSSHAISVYAFDIDRVMPGNILLTRVDFSLKDTKSYVGAIIQRLTDSPFSHAALCIDYGMFIEAIGTGVCRLAIMATGAHKKENLRLLRLKDSAASDASAKASEAARIAQEYVLRGYSKRGAVGVKFPVFSDPQRAQLFCSQLVARAYEEVKQELVANKKSHEVHPGDLERSEVLEDVTDSAIFLLHTDSPPDFYLDDHTRFERPHHWEVATKIEILSDNQVRKALARLNERPASFWDLEKVLPSIARGHWTPRFSALLKSIASLKFISKELSESSHSTNRIERTGP
jgi:hypothetical protein